ncbi:hypothetical protein [Spiroplasma endosymbiont of Aspidapion aeneum]|uniref:hypothetical protein n=1 Tax=Spiroplasma endosymbiont of Aspidapion aeneum TaxID=3066276 RepID=UPI00313AF9D1
MGKVYTKLVFSVIFFILIIVLSVGAGIEFTGEENGYSISITLKGWGWYVPKQSLDGTTATATTSMKNLKDSFATAKDLTIGLHIWGGTLFVFLFSLLDVLLTIGLVVMGNVKKKISVLIILGKIFDIIIAVLLLLGTLMIAIMLVDINANLFKGLEPVPYVSTGTIVIITMLFIVSIILIVFNSLAWTTKLFKEKNVAA